tara:strand:- start:1831 stop:2148 length:318 start_codon:yes stop_codon:yes gene_type:complete
MIFWAVNSIFLLFAVLNINDPDWFLWLPTYLLVVLTTIAYRKNRVNKKAVNLLMAYLFFVFIMSFFGFVEVLDTSSDKMANMDEPKREAVGALMAMVWVFWTSRE